MTNDGGAAADEGASNDRGASAAADELGAHVSAAGGAWRAPGRAEEIGAVVFQIFTKAPSRWEDPVVAPEAAARFRAEAERAGAAFVAVHDSYLINLASPDAALQRRSAECFRRELERAATLGLDAVVTHPGNATDGDKASGIARNADAVAWALETAFESDVPEARDRSAPVATSAPRVLLELTAGAGTSVGGSFEELGQIIRRIPRAQQGRVGVCFDTCHAWVAGYDLRDDFEGVVAHVDDAFGAERIGLFHLNDAKTPFASRRDRHEHIGRGTLGLAPFRRLLQWERFRHVPKLLETPKGADPTASDRENLRVLRALREA